MTDVLEVTGDYRAYQPRGWFSVLACLAGFHRPAMTGTAAPAPGQGCAELVERCKCGAMRLNGAGPWGLAEYRWRRVSHRVSARLISLCREFTDMLRELGYGPGS